MKVIIIGCPGAGKSVLTRRINEFLDYPVMHLDKVYHTGGKTHISKEELVKKVTDFADNNKKWIIDGNYISTLETRVKLADTIILLNIQPEVCLKNAHARAEESINKGKNRDDIAANFDPVMTEEFINFIKDFREETIPRIKEVLKKYEDKTLYIINSYEDEEEFISMLRNKEV